MSGWWLPAASGYAPEVDRLFWSLMAITIGILVLVFGLMIRFAVRYRAGSRVDRGAESRRSWIIEIGWTTATFLVFVGLFVWGARLYLQEFTPPADAMRIYVVGKQWMWKVEYPGGQREINALHLPLDRTVELVVTSEDVIHDFSIPAFRMKHDVLPDRYDSIWFKPTEVGTYHLFCTQFCGLDHARMTGTVTVMEPNAFQQWLDGWGASPDLVAGGRQLFVSYGCAGCHLGNSTVHAPRLEGLYGSPVALSDGRVVTADERYIRDCILLPETERVAGYPPVMPKFAGQIKEDELVQIVAYIKSLGGEAGQ
jgi:cytochrome c oxidase subunit 2